MFSCPDYLILPLLACLAVGLDFIFGEPRRFHPLVGFGNIAKRFERCFNPESRWKKPQQRFVGLVALFLLLAPFVLLAGLLGQLPIVNDVSDVFFLYFAIGHKSLHEHANAVQKALFAQDITLAKKAASYMVSRDSAAVEPIPATIESVLENGNDGVFGALFWFFVAGGLGALLFRLVNTMDAMWGYKTTRFYYFGWAAARLDDVVSYIPARLTALTYALLGQTRNASIAWQKQAPQWESPNAGPVMASGAGALGIQLGGPACYQGEWHKRPQLGAGRKPVMHDIARALALVRNGVYSWLVIAVVMLITFKVLHA